MRDIFDLVPTNYGSNALDRWFGQYFNDPELHKGNFSPSIDIEETDEKYLMSVDLPGIEEKDVEISIDEHVMTIRGKREDQSHHDSKNFKRTERFYGSFVRSFTLPDHVDKQKIVANMENGVLEVELPKKPELEKETRRVEIGKKRSY